jgi:spermidine/putrescine transport system ATP-binding protein
MPEAPLLEIEEIEKSFDGNQVLRGVSLSVSKAEFMTFLGPSGCGKTTTLRIVAGFEKPDRGRVLLGGQDVTSQPAYERDVHTVFQHYALFPHYDVYGNIAFGLRVQRLPEPEIKTRVTEALSQVKLSGFEKRSVSSLSGGQMQRIALARALVGRPALLLLDEPLGALDLKLRKEMQLELKALQRRLGIAFVYVTHDQEEAMTMSDRVAVFNKGVLEQVGTPDEIYERPRTAFVADFIGSANVLDARVVSNDDGGSRLVLEDEVEVIVPGAHVSPGARIQVAVRPENIEVYYEDPPALSNGTVRIKGALRDSVYLGHSSQIFVTPFASGKMLMSVSLDDLHQERRAAGTPIWADIKPKDILILHG